MEAVEAARREQEKNLREDGQRQYSNTENVQGSINEDRSSSPAGDGLFFVGGKEGGSMVGWRYKSGS